MNKQNLDFLGISKTKKASTKRNVTLWNVTEEDEISKRRQVHFKEFSPPKEERRYIYDTLDFIESHAPSDAIVELTIHDYITYFATLSIHSNSLHYLDQVESDSIYELMDLLSLDIFEELEKRIKNGTFGKTKAS